MIDKTLSFILEQLNSTLKPRFSKEEDLVVLSGLTELDGNIPDGISERIVITLINIERENAAASGASQMQVSKDGYARTAAPLNLNLFLLVSASFNHYPTSMEFLSVVLGYFQTHNLFTPQTSKDFPADLEKLSFDLVSLDMQGLNNVWNVLGGKYLPSVIYKARLITIQDAWIFDQVPEITGIGTKL